MFYFLLFSFSLLYEIPIDLYSEITEPIEFIVETDSEFLLNISASTNTNWSISNGESSTLVVIIDGVYSQDIILYAGNNLHSYKCSLGAINNGDHFIQFMFDYSKSSLGAEWIYIESIELIDVQNLSIDEDVFRYSPILYGRDLLSWNESTHTDIPLIMWHDLTMDGSK